METGSELFFKLIQKYEAVKPFVIDTFDEVVTPTIISADDTERSAVFAYPFYGWMKNWNGGMHGGYISCLMDSAMGHLAGTSLPEGDLPPTLSLNVSFINAVLPEEKVLIYAKIEDVKSRVVFTGSRMYSPSDPARTLVSASGQYYRR